MSLDRDATLRQAEKLLRQGKLDGAIAEYVRLIEDQPRDWNAINALGDLYARAGDAGSALAQYVRVGDYLFAEGFLPKAAALYKKALRVNPTHAHSLVRIGDIAARHGVPVDLDPALTIAAARAAVNTGDNATAFRLLLDAARGLERHDRSSEALDALLAAAKLVAGLTPAAHRHPDVMPLCERIAAAGALDAGYECLEVVIDLAVLEGEPDLAIAAVQTFLRHGEHIPALSRLVELCVDAGRDALLRETQARLADACRVAGRTEEARFIDDDLRTVDAASPPGRAHEAGDIEIDLSETLAALEADPAADIEDVFGEMRTSAAQQPEVGDARAQYQRGLDRLLAGETRDAIADLQAAARAPVFRFAAAHQLGRVYLELEELPAAVEWLERAAEVPPPSPDEGFAVLYELADTLERLGEPARALAVLMELDADADGYRDVRQRVEQLSRTQGTSQ